MFRDMRRHKQAVSERECLDILHLAKRGVLSVIGDEGYPYGVPMDFVYNDADGKIYFHCAKEGHKLDAIKSCGKVCFTTWNDGCQKEDWSWYITSVIVFGRAELVTDRETALDAARRLGLKYFPTVEEVDTEIEKAFSSVQMVALTIEHMTGKLIHEK